jgi:hypothetical protein
MVRRDLLVLVSSLGAEEAEPPAQRRLETQA